MFKMLFYKELLENIQNKRFLLAFILCVLVIPLAFYFNHKKYEVERQNYIESVQRYNESHQTVQDLLQKGGQAFRPASPLNILSVGIEQLFPTSIETMGFITLAAKTQFVNDRGMDSPYALLYGFFDLSFIVTLIISALIILFAFNSIVGEKENRTLGQIFCNPVPRHILMLSKISANFLLLCIAFLIGILIGSLILILRGFEIFADQQMLMRFLFGVLVCIIFMLAFFNFGFLVSSLTKNSNIAMVVLISSWVVLFMIFPKLSIIMSKIIKPVESQQVIDLKKNQLRTQIENETEAEVNKLAESIPGFQNQSISQFMKIYRQGGKNAKKYADQQAAIRDEYQIRLETELTKINTHHANKINSQIRLAQNISRLSLFSCFIHLLAEISNTGLLEHQAWRETRVRFEQLMKDEITSKDQMMRFKNFSTGDLQVDRDAPAPRLEYQPIKFHAVLSSVWIDLVLLVFYCILFLVVSYVAFVRYDVR